MKTLLIVAACMILLGSCSKSASTYTADCSGAAKSYKTDVAPVLSGKCTSCHSNYGTYSGANSDKSAIRSAIVDGSMPKGNSLSATEKNAVVCWIDNGAPNN